MSATETASICTCCATLYCPEAERLHSLLAQSPVGAPASRRALLALLEHRAPFNPNLLALLEVVRQEAQ